MPTYNSLGISATLLVTNLDQTLSDEINLRMGKGLQENTKRIQDRLLNGRALQEQPTVPENSKVGIFQFLGEDEDMVLLVVTASDEQSDDEGIFKDSDMVEGGRPESTNVVPTSTNDTTPPHPTPTQTTSGRKKSNRIAKNQRARSNGSKRGEQQLEGSSTTPFDPIAAPTTPAASSRNTRKRSKSLHSHLAEQLALCLKVDLTKFYEKDKVDAPLLSGKDLKLEVFINGHLVEVTYEPASRPYKRSGFVQYSGTRFHRQAEKPWVYVPTAAISSDAVNGTPDQRWDNISGSLAQEADTRGTNTFGQRPISGQFLAALARSQLLEGVKTKSQHFAVIDLIITAGKGRKYGPDTIYLAEPTHLADQRFSALAPVSGGSASLLQQDGDAVLQDDSHMFGGDPMDLTNFQPWGFTGDMFGTPSEQPRIPATPRTPKTMDMNISKRLREILDAKSVKKLLSTYENSKGQVKGKRTLRQRFGDMSKMSPRKQLEVLSQINGELDKDTMKLIMAALEVDDPKLAVSESKKVHFNFGEDDIAPAPTFDEKMRAMFGEDAITSASTFSEAFGTQTLAAAADPFTSTLPQMDPSLLQDNLFGPNPEFDPTTALNANTDVFHTEATVNPADLVQLKRRNMRTPASALSGSPTSTRVKYHHSHRMYDPTMDLMDPFVDGQPIFASPSVHTPPQVTRQQPIGSSTQKSKKAIAREQTPRDAIKKFQVPDLFKGSTVSYADGLKQRQAIKARGGEFEEQQFVVGMRFIVL